MKAFFIASDFTELHKNLELKSSENEYIRGRLKWPPIQISSLAKLGINKILHYDII
jgi:hypothetical protein